jgi:hypothetical protein
MRFAVAGGMFGSRRLGEWMRQEFSAEYDNEQARMRQWLSVRVPAAASSGAQTATTIPALADPGTARAMVRDSAEWRLVSDRDTVVDAASGTVAQPTILLRPGEARAPIFDNSWEQTGALRSDRLGALSRPVPRRSPRRNVVLAGAPLALALIAAAAYFAWRVVGTAPPRSSAVTIQTPREAPPPLQVAETSVASVSPGPAAMASSEQPRLHVVSDPVGAQITLSGRKLGRAPLTTDPLEPDTQYEVMASLEGYQSVRRVVRTTSGVSDVTLFLLIQRSGRTKAPPAPTR